MQAIETREQASSECPDCALAVGYIMCRECAAKDFALRVVGAGIAGLPSDWFGGLPDGGGAHG